SCGRSLPITGKEWLPSSRHDVDFCLLLLSLRESPRGDTLAALGRATSFSLASASDGRFF
ncbi:MAG TPA: hypothetical protein VF772_05675, partial [Terriglobales bacterium]